MKFGGPVWHASVMSRTGMFPPLLRDIAVKTLDGVGDESRGQWEEWTGTAFHVRRRLSSEEQKDIGPAVDIRGTKEFDRRVKAIRKRLGDQVWLQLIGRAGGIH